MPIDGAVLSAQAFLSAILQPSGDDRLLIVNLGVDLQFSTLLPNRCWLLLEQPVVANLARDRSAGIWRVGSA